MQVTRPIICDISAGRVSPKLVTCVLRRCLFRLGVAIEATPLRIDRGVLRY